MNWSNIYSFVKINLFISLSTLFLNLCYFFITLEDASEAGAVFNEDTQELEVSYGQDPNKPEGESRL